MLISDSKIYFNNQQKLKFAALVFTFKRKEPAMFGLGPTELMIILAIVMILFGVGKLPQIGEGLGKAIRNFKGAIHEDTEQASKHIEKEKRIRNDV